MGKEFPSRSTEKFQTYVCTYAFEPLCKNQQMSRQLPFALILFNNPLKRL